MDVTIAETGVGRAFQICLGTTIERSREFPRVILIPVTSERIFVKLVCLGRLS